MKRHPYILTALAGVALLAHAAGARAETIALTGATVYTEPGKIVEQATIVVRDGVIRAIGANLAVPAGARVIDARDRVITAGLVAASSRLGIVEVSLEEDARRGMSGGAPGGRAINAAYDVRESYNPRSVAIPVARAQGVTTVVVEPIGGLIAGTGSCFALGSGPTRDVLMARAVAMYTQFGGGDQETGWMALTRLREVLDDTAAYRANKAAYNRNQSRELAASRLDLEALLPVLQGRTPLVVRTDRASDIEAALELAREFGVRVVIQGGAEAWMLAEDLARAKVAVLLDPSRNLPGSFDSVHARDDNAALLASAGVSVVIANLGSVHNVGTMRQLAGMAVANGMDHDRALAAITTEPAALFGLDRGVIAVGRVADLVVWSGDPFELSTRAERVFVGGEEADLENHQSLLLERYRTLPERALPRP